MKLTGKEAGIWRVSTLSGSNYVLDLDDRTMIRERGVTDFSASLRRDGGEAVLLDLIECTLGRPMELIIDLSWPGVTWTRRTTTAVVKIELIGYGDDTAA